MIKESVRQLIIEQGLTNGDQILSQNQLAERFEVNPLTVHKALTELCAENILYRENGRGTFVGPRPSATRNVALILPGDHLESAESNPDIWPFVSHIVNTFIRSVGSNGSFSTLSIAGKDLATFDLNRLRQFDLVFSLGVTKFHILADRMVASGVACPVFFEAPTTDVASIHVDHDRRESVKLGISELLRKDYKRVGLFCMKSVWGDSDVDGYMDAHSDFGVPVDDELIFRGFSLQKDGLRAASILMSRGMPCDAIFADTDLLALGMIEQFRIKGVSVPGDIGVMGYHGLELATTQPPFLTSVATPYDKMIAWAFNAFDEMKGNIHLSTKLDFIGTVIHGKTLNEETCS
jgi:DNA-binding LacI/PurR family transcriptional regulator